MTQVKQSFSSTGSILAGVITLVIMVIGFGGWSFFAEISGAVISSGRIEVDTNRQVVQHPDGGVVGRILVDDGDYVQQGDILIELDPSVLKSRYHILEGQVNELMARRGRFEAERDGFPDIAFDQRLLDQAALKPEIADLVDGQVRLHRVKIENLRRDVSQLTQRRDQVEDQVIGIEAQQRSLADQLALLKSELRDQQSLLDKGLAQASRVMGLKRENARLMGAMGELDAQKAQAKGKMTEIDIEISKLETRRQEQAIASLRDQQYRELELLEQMRATSDLLGRLNISSPVSGLIYDMASINTGAVIKPAEPVLYIIPQGRPLVIAADIDANNIDQVQIGKPTVLRLPSLDQNVTPELNGEVIRVSADAFVDERSGASYYKAQIILNEGEQERLPEGIALLPGMPVEAFIKTGSHTPMEYFVKPLRDYFVKAFR